MKRIALIAVAAAFSLPAAAQTVVMDRFDQIDTDRNGVISRAEWDLAVQRGPTAYQQPQHVVPGAAAGSTVAPHQGYVSRDYPPRLIYDAAPHISNTYPPTVHYGTVPPR